MTVLENQIPLLETFFPDCISNNFDVPAHLQPKVNVNEIKIFRCCPFANQLSCPAA